MQSKRTKGKYKTDIGSYDRYAFYRDNTEDPVDIKKYREVVNMFNKIIANKILYEPSFEWRLPYGLGRIRIKANQNKFELDANGKLNKKKLKIDWAETRKQGKTVYHENNHTNNTYCKWYWAKWWANVTNKTAYCFIPTRSNKRELASILKDPNCHIFYYE